MLDHVENILAPAVDAWTRWNQYWCIGIISARIFHGNGLFELISTRSRLGVVEYNVVSISLYLSRFLPPPPRTQVRLLYARRLLLPLVSSFLSSLFETPPTADVLSSAVVAAVAVDDGGLLLLPAAEPLFPDPPIIVRRSFGVQLLTLHNYYYYHRYGRTTTAGADNEKCAAFSTTGNRHGISSRTRAYRPVGCRSSSVRS